jgi:hypothetical protein
MTQLPLKYSGLVVNMTHNAKLKVIVFRCSKIDPKGILTIVGFA